MKELVEVIAKALVENPDEDTKDNRYVTLMIWVR